MGSYKAVQSIFTHEQQQSKPHLVNNGAILSYFPWYQISRWEENTSFTSCQI